MQNCALRALEHLRKLPGSPSGRASAAVIGEPAAALATRSLVAPYVLQRSHCTQNTSMMCGECPFSRAKCALHSSNRLAEMRSRLTAWRTGSDFLKAVPTKHAHMDSRVGETGAKQLLTREASHTLEKQLM